VIWLATALVAVFLIVFGIFLLRGAKYQKVADAVVDKPSETDPSKDGYLWQGGPEDPKKIIIPKIGVNNFIQQVGVNEKNEIAAPLNIFIAGWFNQSVRPGQKGLSIIDGHLDGYKKDGIFKNLFKLQRGDELSIELGNGKSKKFKVISVEEVEEKKAMASLFSQNPRVSSQLNLITCGGNYDKNNRYYDKRVIVSAEQIN
jgi:LPXTG-site transpeptidase (sortase) family protein